MLDVLPYLAILLAACGGLSIVLYIIHKKRGHQPMVCPLGQDCSTVIHSEYANFLGIPLERLGLAYYAFIVICYILYILFPALQGSALTFVTFPVSFAAFLFSMYLTFIQAFTLKQWCTWCLGSAGLSSLIFLISLYTDQFTFVPLLIEYRRAIVGLHLLGLALGLGGASVADFFFFKFLKDLRISHQESDMLRSISQVIWLGIAILVISGSALFLTDPLTYSATPKFLLKVLVVGVIIVNGAFLNLLITPKLIHISFGDKHKHHKGELRHERKLAYALGAISFTSWYTAFGMGVLRSSPAGFWTLLTFYVGALCCAVIGSQIMERIIARRGWTLNDFSASDESDKDRTTTSLPRQSPRHRKPY